MLSLNDYEVLYKKIEPIISQADPKSLGGAAGEYDNQINQIIKLVLEKKASITGALLLQIFAQSFPDTNASLGEFSRMAEKINSVL